jgi:hypothetical protein
VALVCGGTGITIKEAASKVNLNYSTAKHIMKAAKAEMRLGRKPFQEIPIPPRKGSNNDRISNERIRGREDAAAS